MCTVSTGSRWGDWLIHGPVGEAVFKSHEDSKRAKAKIKEAELKVGKAPSAEPTAADRAALVSKRMGLMAGQQALAQSRAGTLATSPLGVLGYQRLGKRTLLGA